MNHKVAVLLAAPLAGLVALSSSPTRALAQAGQADNQAKDAGAVVTLAALEQIALSEHAALRAQAARLRSADADVERAQSAYHPQVSAQLSGSLSPGRELLELTNPEDGQTYYVSGSRDVGSSDAFLPQARYGAEVELKGNLYDFGRTAAAVDASRATRAAVAAERKGTRAALLEEVRAAYLAWLGQSELLALAEATRHDALSRRQRVEALIEEGARPAADLAAAQSAELLSELELERARGEAESARLSLSYAVGTPIEEGARPDPALLDAPAGETGAAEPGAPQDDPTLDALSRQRAAAHAAARMHNKESAPVLAGVLSAGLAAQNEDVFPNYAVGVSLTVPLWDGGGTAAKASGDRARAEELAARMELRRNDDNHQRARAELARDNAVRRLKRAEALLTVATQRVAETQERYELGAAAIELVSEAQNLLRRAQSEVLLAKLARAKARVLGM